MIFLGQFAPLAGSIYVIQWPTHVIFLSISFFKHIPKQEILYCTILVCGVRFVGEHISSGHRMVLYDTNKYIKLLAIFSSTIEKY